MAQNNVDIVDIQNEDDLTTLSTLADTDYIHVTRGRKILKTSLENQLLPSGPGEQNVNADWNATSGDAQILNKPTIAEQASELPMTGYIKPGTGGAITDTDSVDVAIGKLERGLDDATAGGGEMNVQADWNESDTGSDAYIQNKPAVPTTASEVANVPTGNLVATDLQAAVNELQSEIDGLSAASGNTNLGYTASPTDGTVTSDTGTDATIPVVNLTNTGLMTPAQNLKLGGIEDNATADQTGTEIVSAIDTELGNSDWQTGGASFTEIDNGKHKMYAKAGTTLNTSTQGVYTYTAANFGDISHIAITATESGDRKANGDLDIVITFSDNIVNTWSNPDGLADIDLYVPMYRTYNFSASALGQSSATPVEIVPEITYGSGTVTLRFLGSSNFASISRVLFQLNFPKL